MFLFEGTNSRMVWCSGENRGRIKDRRPFQLGDHCRIQAKEGGSWDLDDFSRDGEKKANIRNSLAERQTIDTLGLSKSRMISRYF